MLISLDAAGNHAGSAAVSSSKGQLSALMPKAKEFESMLLTQWLRDAEDSFGSVPGGDEEQDAGGQQIRSFATQQLAKGITEAGGIGIASMVAKALAHASTATAAEGAKLVAPGLQVEQPAPEGVSR